MERELKILMLEDHEEDAGLVDRILQKEKMVFKRVRVDTREEFIQAIEIFKPDVILSDHSLPQFNSIEALKICQSKKLEAPFILVTGAVSEEFAVNCLKRGADDYVLKSNLSRLPLAIRYALRQHRYESNRQVQEAMLKKQNEELTKINKELDSFVYSVSHDLRSPLSSILGLVNVAKLDNQKNKETITNYFDMIERSVLKLDETLREILDYSRNARGELIISEIDLSQLITATITPAHVVLVISDNGIGIHPDYLRNVFNMFYRATDRSQGAGLGLYIVKEMVEKMEGTIIINSEFGKETLISLTIPNKLLQRS
jgi:signal transduction histidine kinase